MQKKSLYLVVVFSLMLLHAVAQRSDTVIASYPVAYIKSMKDYLSFKLSANNNTEGFITKTSAIKFDLRPNDKVVTRLAVNYRFLSFAIAVTPKFLPQNRDNELKGKSRFTAFALNLNFNTWIQSASYSRSQGYYLFNTAGFRPGWEEDVDPYIQFPDLIYKSFHGRTSYKFNKKFSFNSLNIQTERQLKSAGTFMPSLSYLYYIVDDRSKLTGQGQTQKSNNFQALLAASYYYTFVFRKKWYASVGAAPGVGLIFSKLLTRTTTDQVVVRYNNPIYTWEATTAVGYNAERFFAGIQLSASSTIYSRRHVTNVIENDQAAYQVFFGYRLQVPRFLKQLINKAEQKETDFFHNIKKK